MRVRPVSSSPDPLGDTPRTSYTGSSSPVRLSKIVEMPEGANQGGKSRLLDGSTSHPQDASRSQSDQMQPPSFADVQFSPGTHRLVSSDTSYPFDGKTLDCKSDGQNQYSPSIFELAFTASVASPCYVPPAIPHARETFQESSIAMEDLVIDGTTSTHIQESQGLEGDSIPVEIGSITALEWRPIKGRHRETTSDGTQPLESDASTKITLESNIPALMEEDYDSIEMFRHVLKDPSLARRIWSKSVMARSQDVEGLQYDSLLSSGMLLDGREDLDSRVEIGMEIEPLVLEVEPEPMDFMEGLRERTKRIREVVTNLSANEETRGDGGNLSSPLGLTPPILPNSPQASFVIGNEAIDLEPFPDSRSLFNRTVPSLNKRKRKFSIVYGSRNPTRNDARKRSNDDHDNLTSLPELIQPTSQQGRDAEHQYSHVSSSPLRGARESQKKKRKKKNPNPDRLNRRVTQRADPVERTDSQRIRIEERLKRLKEIDAYKLEFEIAI